MYFLRHLMRPDKALPLCWKYKLDVWLVGRKPDMPSARLVMPPSAQIKYCNHHKLSIFGFKFPSQYSKAAYLIRPCVPPDSALCATLLSPYNGSYSSVIHSFWRSPHLEIKGKNRLTPLPWKVATVCHKIGSLWPLIRPCVPPDSALCAT